MASCCARHDNKKKSGCHQCKTQRNWKRSADPPTSVVIPYWECFFHSVYMPNLPRPSNWNCELEPTVNKHVLTASTYTHAKRTLVIRWIQLLQHGVMRLWQPLPSLHRAVTLHHSVSFAIFRSNNPDANTLLGRLSVSFFNICSLCSKTMEAAL